MTYKYLFFLLIQQLFDNLGFLWLEILIFILELTYNECNLGGKVCFTDLPQLK